MRGLKTLVVAAVIVGLVVAGSSCENKEELTSAPACRADFSASPTELDGRTLVHFSDRSTGEITEWEWDLNGDGMVDDTRQNPTYYYDADGTYSVTLTITGPRCTDTDTKTDYVHARGCAT